MVRPGVIFCYRFYSWRLLQRIPVSVSVSCKLYSPQETTLHWREFLRRLVVREQTKVRALRVLYCKHLHQAVLSPALSEYMRVEVSLQARCEPIQFYVHIFIILWMKRLTILSS